MFLEVAQYVQARRRNGLRYPIYITDLDLSTRFRQQIGAQSLRPLELLNYKKRFEIQLTRALNREATSDDRVAMAS